MSRCSEEIGMRFSVLILLAALGLGPAQAEEFISDGFGLVPRSATGEGRFQ